MTVGELINKIGFKVKNEDVNKVNSTVAQIKDKATKVLGAIGVAFSATALNNMIEDYGRVNDQIRNSTKALGDQKEIQEKILAAAGRTRTTYQQTATVVANLVHENAELFGTIDEAIAFNDAATMLFKTAGKTNEDIAGLMEAINKSFAKGYIDSETLSQLLERAPEAVEILNEYLGTTSDQLEQLASDGEFSVAQLKDAFVSNSETIAQNFSLVQYRISEAITHIRDKFGYWLADLDQTTGLTSAISRMMVSGFNGMMGVLNKVRDGVINVTNKFGGMQRVLRFIAIAAASIFLALNIGKIIAGVSTMISWFKTLNLAMLLPYLKIALLAAAFIALGLIIEDFYHFMKGNDSLLGEMLERAGVDCDALREKITTTWQNIVDFITPLWEGFVSVFTYLGEQLSAFWTKYGDDILGGIGKVVSFIAEAIASVVSWITGSESAQDVMFNLGQAIGMVVAAIMIAIPVIGAINGAIALLTNPVFWVIAALVALIAVIYLVIDNWELIKEKAAEIWEAIKEFFAETLEAIADFFKSIWTSIKAWLSNVWNQIKTTAINVWNSIKTALSNILNAIKTTMQNVWNTIKTTITNILNNIKTTVTNIWNSIKSFLSTVLNAIKTTVTNVWNAIKDFMSSVLNAIKTTVTNIWNAIKSTISSVMEAIRSTVSSIWSAIQSTTSAIWEAIKAKVSEVVNGIKETVTSVFESVKSTVSNVWNNIKQTISDAMTNAWQTVKDMVAKIKDAFNFEWTLPKFKLPHVSVHGGTPPYGIGGEGSLPSFSVEWYRKGGILDGATIFGSMGGKLLGGGEAGKEAVIPLSELWKEMRSIIRDGINDVTRAMRPFMDIATVTSSTVSHVSNSSVTRNIIQNVKIENEFNGDKAIQREASTAMKKSARDVTAELAKGLNFT